MKYQISKHCQRIRYLFKQIENKSKLIDLQIFRRFFSQCQNTH